MTPFVAEDVVNEDTSFIMFMLLVITNGFASAVIQSTVFGFAGLLPSIYTQAAVTGQAAAGILVSVKFLRFFVLFFFYFIFCGWYSFLM